MEKISRYKNWALVPRSEIKENIMIGKWTLNEKPDCKLKARQFSPGFAEPFADETYIYVLPPTSLRILLAFASLCNYQTSHDNTIAAFLHIDID